MASGASSDRDCGPPARGLLGRLALIAAAALLATACSTTPPPLDDPEAFAEYQQINDPYESFNRDVFEVNEVFDAYLLKPATDAYRWVFPKPVRKVVSNFLSNIGLPLVFVNDVLQANFEAAGVTTTRLIVNTTAGVGGLFDVATDLGLPGHGNDFGLTMGTYGLHEGPYLMLPVFGPSNPRDAIGRVVDTFLDPVSYFYWTNHRNNYSWIQTGLSALDARDRYYDDIENLRESSLDFYAAMRSLYRQNRAAEVEERKAWRDGREDPPGI